MPRRSLLIGFFSTIGDINCLNVVRRSLDAAREPYDVAAYSDSVGKAIEGAIPLHSAKPEDYSHLVVICGPCWRGVFSLFGFDIGAFAHCRRIGINLTMVEPVEQWNPFHVLLERDSDRMTRPDLSLLDDEGVVPVVGLCVVYSQGEYGARQRHELSVTQMESLVARKGASFVSIDTHWPRKKNSGGLGSPAQVASLMAKTDLVLTNRLHGLVFSMKKGVPAIAFDPVAGGDKVTAQAKVLGWPVVVRSDSVTENQLDELYEWCLTEEARAEARQCAAAAIEALHPLTAEFMQAMDASVGERPVPAEPPVPPLVRLRTSARRLGKRLQGSKLISR